VVGGIEMNVSQPATGGSASTTSLSRPAQASLALRLSHHRPL
jgi:hypothetical protein